MELCHVVLSLSDKNHVAHDNIVTSVLVILREYLFIFINSAIWMWPLVCGDRNRAQFDVLALSNEEYLRFSIQSVDWS